MREIKFKGKWLDGRVDGSEWVYGYYSSCVEFGDNGGVEHLYMETVTELHYISTKDGETYIVDPDTVGQYTGLKDSRRTEEYPEGQEIYEGDIIYICAEEENGVVAWDETELEYVIHTKDLQLRMGCFYSRELQIIGNIHDNPELLEV